MTSKTELISNFVLQGDTADDLQDAVMPILEENTRVVNVGIGPYEFWGSRSVDNRMGAELNVPQLVCEVTEFDSVPLQTGGTYTAGGCQCDDEIRGPCKCPPERDVCFTVCLEKIVRQDNKLFAIYEFEETL
jgi:hypothetical protein